jgi:hypothetical protein
MRCSLDLNGCGWLTVRGYRIVWPTIVFENDWKSTGAGDLCDNTVKDLVWVDSTLRVSVACEGSLMATAQLGKKL